MERKRKGDAAATEELASGVIFSIPTPTPSISGRDFKRSNNY